MCSEYVLFERDGCAHYRQLQSVSLPRLLDFVRGTLYAALHVVRWRQPQSVRSLCESSASTDATALQHNHAAALSPLSAYNAVALPCAAAAAVDFVSLCAALTIGRVKAAHEIANLLSDEQEEFVDGPDHHNHSARCAPFHSSAPLGTVLSVALVQHAIAGMQLLTKPAGPFAVA
jgi:hypothetical protein